MTKTKTTTTKAKWRARIARPLVAAAAVAGLGCTAACGSGGSGPDGRRDPDGASSGRTAGDRAGGGGRAGTPAQESPEDRRAQDGQGGGDSRNGEKPRGTPKAGGRAAGPLSEARLKKAALATGDVRGFAVEESDGAELLGRSVPAVPSKCQPIADMFLFATAPPSEAGVSRGVTVKDESDASVITLALLSYGSGEADEVVDGLRSATKRCTSYRHTGYAYRDVKALAGPDLGDESVAFGLVASIEGAQVPAAYTVVRDGTTLVAFSSMNMLDAGKVEVPPELVEAQLGKLAESGKRTG